MYFSVHSGDFNEVRPHGNQKYHESIGEGYRNICLIPTSTHGTNPATANICGLKIIPIGCDDKGNIMLDEVEELGQKHAKRLSCIMITYPSTHGAFECSTWSHISRIHRC